jgi:hypothetical protein
MTQYIGDFPNKGVDFANGDDYTAAYASQVDKALYLVDQFALKGGNNRNFNMDRDYFYKRNNRAIYSGETLTAMDANCTASADSTNTHMWAQGSKMLHNGTGVHFVGATRTFTAVDCTKFNDGSASSTSDYLVISGYCPDTSKLDGALRIQFGTNGSNYFYGSIAITQGWFHAQVLKSSLSNYGSPSWATIGYVKFYFYTTSGATGAEYVTMQLAAMVRDSADRPYASATQRYNGSTWADYYYVETYLVSISDSAVATYPVLARGRYAGATYDYVRLLNEEMSSFFLKAKVAVKLANYSTGFRWWTSSENWVSTYLDSGTLYLDVYENGVKNTGLSKSVATGVTIAKNSLLAVRFFRDGSYFRADWRFGTTGQWFLETAATFTDRGYVYWGQYGDTGMPGYLCDFYLGNGIPQANYIDD